MINSRNQKEEIKRSNLALTEKALFLEDFITPRIKIFFENFEFFLYFIREKEKNYP